MESFESILNRHGARNSGDDLLGFEIDMEHFLETDDAIEWAEVVRRGRADCMLEATCKFVNGTSLEDAKRVIERIWDEDLRYSNYEVHKLIDTDKGFEFRFVTTSLNLGVIGTIQCWL
jgi:hypothetical protein